MADRDAENFAAFKRRAERLAAKLQNERTDMTAFKPIRMRLRIGDHTALIEVPSADHNEAPAVEPTEIKR